MLRLLVLSVFPSVWAARVSRSVESKRGESGAIVPLDDFEPAWKALVELPSAGDLVGEGVNAYIELLALDNPTQEDYNDIAKGLVKAVLTSAAPMLMTTLALVKALVLRANRQNSATKESNAVATAILNQAQHMIRDTLLIHEITESSSEFIHWTEGLAGMDMANPLDLWRSAAAQRPGIFGQCRFDVSHDAQGDICKGWRTVKGAETFLLEVLYTDIEMEIITEGLSRSSGDATKHKGWKTRATTWGEHLAELLSEHALAFKRYRIDNASMFTDFDFDRARPKTGYISTATYRAGKDVYLDQAITCGQGCLSDETEIMCHMQHSNGKYPFCNDVNDEWVDSWKSCLAHYKEDFVLAEYRSQFFNKYSKQCDAFPRKCTDWLEG